MINSISKTVKDYSELIEKQARIEYKRLPSNYLIDFSEVLNIAATAVYVVLTTHKGQEYNKSYMSTAIKWAIRNELRRRYRWYSARTKVVDEQEDDEDGAKREEIRETIYEAVLSIDEMEEGENPVQIKDDSTAAPDDYTELKELSKAVREAIEKLPEREKEVIKARFYDNRKIRELARDYNISSSRVSRVIQTALNRIKKELSKKNIVAENLNL